ncbi:Reverse transcriptase domain protein [Ceratobasidium sp. AG-Ba]|nr:Reverse transcriptase domain protein [Ceratobasidium sp. AG-Ba]
MPPQHEVPAPPCSKKRKRKTKRARSPEDASSGDDSDSADSSEGVSESGDESSSGSDSSDEDRAKQLRKIHKLQKKAETLLAEMKDAGPSNSKRKGKNKSGPVRDRHCSEKSDGVLASAVGSKIPRKVEKIAEDGWKEHISLVLLTNEYCESREAAADTDRINWIMKHGRVTLAASPVTTSKSELDLNFAEWTQAWRRLLILIGDHFPKRYLDRWRAHFNYIFRHENRDCDWRLWLQYDCSVRERATQESIDPSTFQANIFNHFVLEQQLHPTPAAPATSALPAAQADKKGKGSHFGVFGVAGLTHMAQAHAHTQHKPAAGTSSLLNPQPEDHGSLTADCSATNSTPPPDASRPTAISNHTDARFVGVPPMEHNSAPPDPRKVVTPLLPDKWEAVLHAPGLLEEFGDIPGSLCEGFRIGAAGPVSTTKSVKIISHPQIVQIL